MNIIIPHNSSAFKKLNFNLKWLEDNCNGFNRHSTTMTIKKPKEYKGSYLYMRAIIATGLSQAFIRLMSGDSLLFSY